MDFMDEIKNEFLKRNGHYFKKEELPNYNSPEVDFLIKTEIEYKLGQIKENTRIIKNCAVAFLVLQAISFALSLIAIFL